MSDNATMKNTTIHDMTTGSPARLIMQFMIPMFLGNIFQQFLRASDDTRKSISAVLQHC